MKRTHQLNRGYAGLTAGERVQLAIAALARSDDREFSLIEDSSPKQKYIGCERSFDEFMRLAAEFATAVAAIDIAPRAAKLELFELIRTLAETLFTELEEGEMARLESEGDDQSVADPAQLFLEVLVEAERALRAEAAAVTNGFAAFCADVLKVGAEQLLAAFAQPFHQHFAQLVAGDGDPTLRLSYQEDLTAAWRHRRQLQARQTPVRSSGDQLDWNVGSTS